MYKYKNKTNRVIPSFYLYFSLVLHCECVFLWCVTCVYSRKTRWMHRKSKCISMRN